MSLGKIAYQLYFRPIGAVKQSIREGGPIEQWKTERGRKEMERAAHDLGLRIADCGLSGPPSHKAWPPKTYPSPSDLLPPGDSGYPLTRGDSEGLKRNSEFENKAKTSGLTPLELHMVVGKKFWYMAAFAVASLLKVLDRGLIVYLYSDGSLTKEHAEALKRLPIQARIYSADEIQDRVEKGLPRGRFPILRERFENYPNIQKLISPHVGGKGVKIVLDADVLFFRRPDELMEWQENPKGVLCATDIKENYGYPTKLLERIAEGRLAREVNVGITGLVSEMIDWDLLEKWCAELHANRGTSYYLEQALIAMLGVKAGYSQLERNKFITYPSEIQMRDRMGNMQHYVDLSKKWYFREIWRRVLID